MNSHPPDEGRDTSSNTSDDSFYDALTMTEDPNHSHVLSFDVLNPGEASHFSDDSFFDAFDIDKNTDCSDALFFFDTEAWDSDSCDPNHPSDPDCPSPTPNAYCYPLRQYPYSQMTLNLSHL